MKIKLAIKRISDFLFALFVIIVSSPIMLLLMPLIKLESKGPAFFCQPRVGKDGKPFVMYKFRTMHLEAPKQQASELIDTQYITKLGTFLRKTSLDELPQFFNILKGDMSLIGPRPVVATERKLVGLRKKLGVYKMLPGLTGWAQINGRDEISYRQKAELDAYYVNNWSISLDLKIFFNSVIPVIIGKDIKEGNESDGKEFDEED